MRLRFLSGMGLSVLPLLALATAPVPELQRPVGTAQAIGAVHTLRQIPEACVRMEGLYTGQTAQPYRFSLLRSSPTCQPRARYVEFSAAHPSEASGWKLNEIIRVPSAACPTQQVVVSVWRRPLQVQATLDGQGQSRIYLNDAKQQATAGKIAPVPLYTAQMVLEGQGCK